MKTLTLTISQFNNFIKKILDAEEFLSNIALIGEVTNFKLSAGNAFFDLKDETAMISCVKFSAYDLDIKNGDKITVYGKINFYVKSGKINFLVSKATAFGQGEIYQQFLFLKDKLEKEGLFLEKIKKSIPRFAKKIGVVTSEKGAVIRDIINVTRSKNPYTDIIVFPSKVQGAGAEDELVRGIEYFNLRNDIDTIIIARGGGSLEDLAPFNTEKIVRAIYKSNLPVISGVGHETDFTLCDFASDLRVPTPSVAAEVAVFDYYEIMQNILQITQKNGKNIQNIVIKKQKEIKLTSNILIDKINLKLIDNYAKVKTLIYEIENLANQIFAKKSKIFEQTVSVISKQNPLELLKKGFVVAEINGKKILSVNKIKVDDEIKINFSDGYITAKVTNTNKGENNGIWNRSWKA